MELAQILEVVKYAPDGLSALAILAVVVFSFLHKRKDIDTSNMIAISELQTNQMSKLIEQNSSLSKELHVVREELQTAYHVINDMRKRVIELEDLVKK
jgi:hypothetical protein